MSRDKYMYAIPAQHEIKLNARTPRKFYCKMQIE